MQIWAVGRNYHLLLGTLFNWVFCLGDQTWINAKFWKRTITVVSVTVVS